MSPRELLAMAERAGVRLYREGDRVRWQARSQPPLELIEILREYRDELAQIVPIAEPGDWRAALATWPPSRHVRWAVKAAVLEVLDHLPAEEADRRAYEALADEPEGAEWVVAGGDGQLRLIVKAEPPWRREVFEAAAIVELIDRHHHAGEDALAATAATRLEGALVELRRVGIEAWLSS